MEPAHVDMDVDSSFKQESRRSSDSCIWSRYLFMTSARLCLAARGRVAHVARDKSIPQGLKGVGEGAALKGTAYFQPYPHRGASGSVEKAHLHIAHFVCELCLLWL